MLICSFINPFLQTTFSPRDRYRRNRCSIQTSAISSFKLSLDQFNMSVPPTMRAFLQNGPDTSHFAMGSIQTPAIQPNQVLIEVHAASLNPIDYKRVNIAKDEFPTVVGYDVAGVVCQVGSQVTKWKVGDAVFADVMRNSVGLKVSGTVAQYCPCDEDLLAVVPEGVSFNEAAATPVAVLTAIQIFDIHGLKEGDNILITAGSGAVGTHATQLAKYVYKAGHIATTASTQKIDFVKQFGADTVIDYKKENAAEKLPAWANMILDCTSEAEMEKKILKENGKLISISDFSTPGIIAHMLEPNTEIIEKLSNMLKDKTITVVIDSIYKFEESMKAMEYCMSGRAKGKIVIDVKA